MPSIILNIVLPEEAMCSAWFLSYFDNISPTVHMEINSLVLRDRSLQIVFLYK